MFFKADLANTPLVDCWEMLLDDITHRRWRPGETRSRLIFAAIIYFIWHERNGRLFTSTKRTADQIVTEVKKVVTMRLWSGVRRELMVRLGDAQSTTGD